MPSAELVTSKIATRIGNGCENPQRDIIWPSDVEKFTPKAISMHAGREICYISTEP